MAIFNAVPTQAELKAMFTYHSDGFLIWKIKTAKKINIGDIAGNIKKDGYAQIMINGVPYQAHRLIYNFFNGNLLPTDIVDHIEKTEKNEVKSNKIENLRKNTPNGNGRNCGVSKNSKSGVKGVSWDSQAKKYRAQICVSGKTEKLGRFTNKFEAYEVYRKRCLEVDPISYSDNSKDFRPDILIEYQEYLLQKEIIEAASPNRYAAINDQKFNIFELVI